MPGVPLSPRTPADASSFLTWLAGWTLLSPSIGVSPLIAEQAQG